MIEDKKKDCVVNVNGCRNGLLLVSHAKSQYIQWIVGDNTVKRKQDIEETVASSLECVYEMLIKHEVAFSYL